MSFIWRNGDANGDGRGCGGGRQRLGLWVVLGRAMVESKMMVVRQTSGGCWEYGLVGFWEAEINQVW